MIRISKNLIGVFSAIAILLVGLFLLYKTPFFQEKMETDGTRQVVDGHITILPSDESKSNSKSNITSLDGEWLFYWNQLLNPSDLVENKKLQQPQLMKVPSVWNRPWSFRESYPRFGFGTYVITLHFNDAEVGKNQALLIEGIGSAYRVWIDGQMAGELGEVGVDAKVEKPSIRLKLFYFTPRSKDMHVLIQVSNFSFRDSGIFGNVEIGPADEMTIYYFKRYLMQDILMIGIFFVISLFALIIYVRRTQERLTMWLGLLSFFFALRIILFNKLLLHLAIPGISWEFGLRIQYLSTIFVMACYFMLIHTFYVRDIHRYAIRFFAVGLLFFVVNISVTPTGLISPIIFLQVALIIGSLCYYFCFLGILTIQRKRVGAIGNFIGTMVVIVCMANDLFNVLHLVNGVLLIPYGFLFHFLILSIYITKRYNQLLDDNIQMAVALRESNVHLEDKVEQRTEELYAKNRQLNQLNRDRAMMMSNIAHDFGSPITAMQTYFLMKQRELDRVSNQDPMIERMLSKLMFMRQLTTGLLELSRLESRKNEFDFESFSIKHFAEGILELVEDEVLAGSILAECQVDWSEKEADTWLVSIDRHHLKRAFQNVLENAVKFSAELPCRVNVRLSINDHLLDEKLLPTVRIAITDDGIGITEQDMPFIFDRFYKSDAEMKGSGLGLAIVRAILQRHGGTIGVKSQIGVGSTFTLAIPIERAMRNASSDIVTD